jgi:hypothetical protein
LKGQKLKQFDPNKRILEYVENSRNEQKDWNTKQFNEWIKDAEERLSKECGLKYREMLKNKETIKKEHKLFEKSIYEARMERERCEERFKYKEALKQMTEDNKKKIYVQRDKRHTELIEAVDKFEIIPSDDVKERKERMHEELMKKMDGWYTMDQEKFEKKQQLEIEAYNNDMKYDQLSEDENDIIFEMSLGKFSLKLNRNDLREGVKVEIYKAACRKIGNNMGNYSKKAKNQLLYYRFGSSRKKKKYNYLMQIGDEAIIEMYDLEKIGKTISEMNSPMGFRIARKYQIKEIIWEDNGISETTKHRARIWSALYKLRGDVKYRTSKWKIEA